MSELLNMKRDEYALVSYYSEESSIDCSYHGDDDDDSYTSAVDNGRTCIIHDLSAVLSNGSQELGKKLHLEHCLFRDYVSSDSEGLLSVESDTNDDDCLSYESSRSQSESEKKGEVQPLPLSTFRWTTLPSLEEATDASTFCSNQDSSLYSLSPDRNEKLSLNDTFASEVHPRSRSSYISNTNNCNSGRSNSAELHSENLHSFMHLHHSDHTRDEKKHTSSNIEKIRGLKSKLRSIEEQQRKSISDMTISKASFRTLSSCSTMSNGPQIDKPQQQVSSVSFGKKSPGISNVTPSSLDIVLKAALRLAREIMLFLFMVFVMYILYSLKRDGEIHELQVKLNQLKVLQQAMEIKHQQLLMNHQHQTPILEREFPSNVRFNLKRHVFPTRPPWIEQMKLDS
mmetsp:Transcript_27510/g.32101  ORF Transcript_27510/g.32101 Transcript_27510/m.32101 type:complete len:398 (-) Transcript_27510:30-1223(-)